MIPDHHRGRDRRGRARQADRWAAGKRPPLRRIRARGDRSYVEQLSWYDDELRRDPYVLGFAVFNAGDPSGEWATFDITHPARITNLVQGK